MVKYEDTKSNTAMTNNNNNNNRTDVTTLFGMMENIEKQQQQYRQRRIVVVSSSPRGEQPGVTKWRSATLLNLMACAMMLTLPSSFRSALFCRGFSIARGGGRPPRIGVTSQYHQIVVRTQTLQPLFLSPSSSQPPSRQIPPKNKNNKTKNNLYYKGTTTDDDTDTIVVVVAPVAGAAAIPRRVTKPTILLSPSGGGGDPTTTTINNVACLSVQDCSESVGAMTSEWKRFLDEQDLSENDTDDDDVTKKHASPASSLLASGVATTSNSLAEMTVTTMTLKKDHGANLQQGRQGTQQHQQQPQKLVSAANARWLLIVSAALYGTNFAVVKSLVDVVPPEIFGTLRFGLAALATLPWLWPTSTVDRDDYWSSEEWGSTVAGLEVGMWTSIGYIAQAVGLGTTLASTSAFVCSMAVVVVPVLDWVLSRGTKNARREQWAGIVLALIGVALLEFGGNADSAAATSSSSFLGLGSGDLITMIQPVAFGIGFVRMEAAMRQFPMQAKRTTAAQLLAVFLGSAAFMKLHPTPNVDTDQLWSTLTHDPTIWAGLVWTGIVTTALTVYMETVALQTLSATETTLIFSTEPLWGSFAAALLLHESFGPQAIVGGSMIVGACLVSSLGWDRINEFLKPRSAGGGQ